MTGPWFDRAEEYARLVSARYYDQSLSAPVTRDDMDAAIAASMRAYAEERLREERLRARYGDSPELIASALTGRREFTAPWAQAIVRAAVTGEAVDARLNAVQGGLQSFLCIGEGNDTG